MNWAHLIKVSYCKTNHIVTCDKNSEGRSLRISMVICIEKPTCLQSNYVTHCVVIYIISMKGLYTRGNYKFNKIPLQLIEVNPHVIHHLESNLYVSHVVINNHTVCCCYYSKYSNVD